MAAITSETFRGALKSISAEQHDACIALSLSPQAMILYVIFAQALLRAIPPLLSNIVSLFKESALISSVGAAHLMFVGQNISNSTARPVEFLTTIAMIYFLVAFPLTRLVGVVNLLLPPTRPEAHAGFIVLQADKAHPMSGSNAICVVTALLELGMVEMQEPETTVVLDTPAGLVTARATCREGRCTGVSLDMVPSFVEQLLLSLQGCLFHIDF
jgi:hypothetical protein